MSIRPHARRQRGLTMVELIVFILVIGVAVAGVLGTLTTVTQRSADPLIRKQAMLLAESLLEEVALSHFTYCHPDAANAESAASTAACASLPEAFGRPAGEVRPYFNVNDYVAAAGVPAAFNPSDPSGDNVTDVSGNPMVPPGYRALVSISPVSGFGPAGMQIGSAGASADSDVLRITVDVRYGDNQHIILERYRTRYAPNSVP